MSLNFSTANIVYVKNLSPLVTEEDIRNTFQHCDEIVKNEFKLFPGLLQRYCEIEFKTSKGINNASLLNNTKLLGLPMHVSVISPVLNLRNSFIQNNNMNNSSIFPGLINLDNSLLRQNSLSPNPSLTNFNSSISLSQQKSNNELVMQSHLSNVQAVQSAAMQAKLLAEKKISEIKMLNVFNRSSNDNNLLSSSLPASPSLFSTYISSNTTSTSNIFPVVSSETVTSPCSPISLTNNINSQSIPLLSSNIINASIPSDSNNKEFYNKKSSFASKNNIDMYPDTSYPSETEDSQISRTIFVDNININVKEDEIKTIFEKYGKITAIRCDKRNDNSKNKFCLIEFFSQIEAKNLLEKWRDDSFFSLSDNLSIDKAETTVYPRAPTNIIFESSISYFKQKIITSTGSSSCSNSVSSCSLNLIPRKSRLEAKMAKVRALQLQLNRKFRKDNLGNKDDKNPKKYSESRSQSSHSSSISRHQSTDIDSHRNYDRRSSGKYDSRKHSDRRGRGRRNTHRSSSVSSSRDRIRIKRSRDRSRGKKSSNRDKIQDHKRSEKKKHRKDSDENLKHEKKNQEIISSTSKSRTKTESKTRESKSHRCKSIKKKNHTSSRKTSHTKANDDSYSIRSSHHDSSKKGSEIEKHKKKTKNKDFSAPEKFSSNSNEKSSKVNDESKISKIKNRKSESPLKDSPSFFPEQTLEKNSCDADSEAFSPDGETESIRNIVLDDYSYSKDIEIDEENSNESFKSSSSKIENHGIVIEKDDVKKAELSKESSDLNNKDVGLSPIKDNCIPSINNNELLEENDNHFSNDLRQKYDEMISSNRKCNELTATTNILSMSDDEESIAKKCSEKEIQLKELYRKQLAKKKKIGDVKREDPNFQISTSTNQGNSIQKSSSINFEGEKNLSGSFILKNALSGFIRSKDIDVKENVSNDKEYKNEEYNGKNSSKSYDLERKSYRTSHLKDAIERGYSNESDHSIKSYKGEKRKPSNIRYKSGYSSSNDHDIQSSKKLRDQDSTERVRTGVNNDYCSSEEIALYRKNSDKNKR